ncbi:2-phospho-L-lactate guanylyltransferase [Amycolatopsis cihanbeyliensis]|uniref:2-phospho-L-lactate guanylyltransferase n=1 Tax=Amycolatopsis cihanbeyliensis TaxID=1128664 RepID=A0A542DH66_AMYCI|nr:2-phospho-L-lactate guanylyltransferase [Amycolatopsis cihanbeyliensis]TQJ02394.1 2-phospho-L-lactate guanylyltransferase [Amycolatopsis cihanbeyliensis]
MKPPHAGKSRLRGVAGADHAALVLALAADTVAAAAAAEGVRRLLVVATDPVALAELRRLGADVVSENGAGGLNAALRRGEAVLRADSPCGVVGALQADLPALRPAELAEALTEASGGRSFVADRHGTGTTLLLSAPGAPLEPRFGHGSAGAHAASGAVALAAPAPSLRGDVDTADDLAHARLIGIGERTAAALGEPACLR